MTNRELARNLFQLDWLDLQGDSPFVGDQLDHLRELLLARPGAESVDLLIKVIEAMALRDLPEFESLAHFNNLK